MGILDATMYRDDFRMRLKQPAVRTTDIRFDISNKHLVLIDDVMYTGRTARAAMDALMDMGRPASVRFLVVVDRGLRELPVYADIVGLQVPTFPGEEVRVRLKEIDNREGVWLVETPRAKSRGTVVDEPCIIYHHIPLTPAFFRRKGSKYIQLSFEPFL